MYPNWLSHSACSDCSMKQAVEIVPPVEAVGILAEVARQMFVFDAVMSSVDPRLGVGDEFVDPRQPAPAEFRVS